MVEETEKNEGNADSFGLISLNDPHGHKRSFWTNEKSHSRKHRSLFDSPHWSGVEKRNMTSFYQYPIT